MKITKKRMVELQARGKKAGLFEDLTIKEIEDLKLPYVKEGVRITFPEDIDKNVIKSSIGKMNLSDSKFDINSQIKDSLQWVGEVDNVKTLDDGSIVCNLLIMDKDIAIYLEEDNSYTIDPALKFKGTKTKYFDFDNFMLVKNKEPDEEEPIEEAEEYVLKSEYGAISAEFSKLQDETIKAIKNFETQIEILGNTVKTKDRELSQLSDKVKTLNKSVSDRDTLLDTKNESIARFQERAESAEKLVAKYKEKVDNEIKEKKRAKFEEVFKNYCNAHHIKESEYENKRKDLSSLSGESLEMINKDSLKLMGKFSSTEERTYNSQESLKTVNIENQTKPKEMSSKEVTDSLFEKLQKINNI